MLTLLPSTFMDGPVLARAGTSVAAPSAATATAGSEQEAIRLAIRANAWRRPGRIGLTAEMPGDRALFIFSRIGELTVCPIGPAAASKPDRKSTRLNSS